MGSSYPRYPPDRIMFALIDCNNFYASCERLFRPDLHNKPIVVLSNNDGCIIARSNETKALGIKMGEPFFKVKAFCKQHHVHVFSSNYTLYGDLSDRVMAVIQASWPQTEIYSIDEAFLHISTLPCKELPAFSRDLQKKILRHTGIPTSIGIGKTKTLAKLANYVAKKQLRIPVFDITGKSSWLDKIPVSSIWGVGRQWTKRLNAIGIFTAQHLKALDFGVAKHRFNVALQRTVMELNEIPCLALETEQPKQSIISSCSFGSLQTDYAPMQEAISHHCATAWEKMRRQGLIAQHMSVFIRSNAFRDDLPSYSNLASFSLVHATDDIRLLTQYARTGLKKIFKPGIHYHKSGVLLAGLVNKNHRQRDLFTALSDQSLQQGDNMMQVMDRINTKYGSRTIRLAAEGFNKAWSMSRQLKSPHYTTRWSDLPTVMT